MDFKVDKSVFVCDFRSLLKCEFDLEGVNPGRHKVSVYRNQVKKKISAAGMASQVLGKVA